MGISDCFSEIITHVDLLIKYQKEQINSAIDIPDWEEAQEVMKHSYENISKLKILKEKTCKLRTEFEASFLFNDMENAQDDSERKNEEAVFDKAENIEATIVKGTQEPQQFQSETNNNTDIEDDKEQLVDDNNKLSSVKVPKELPDKPSFPDESEQWLSLKEDFQNTKIKAVLIDGKKIYVKDLTEVLVITCEWFVKKDRATFERMLKAPFVHGKRQRYLSTQPFESSTVSFSGSSLNKYYKKLNNENIYVWTNTNSNAKANLIANMLKFFNLNENTIMLAVREDYCPEEREYSGRERQPNDTPLPDWSEPDSSEYSAPVVHERKKSETEPAESSVNYDMNNTDTSADSKLVVDLCEELILKKPYKMALAYESSKMGSYFSTQKNDARNNFSSPHCLSNGLWVETAGVSEQQLNFLKEFCGINK